MAAKYTPQEFIERARDVHGNAYDYSKTEYKNAGQRVTITCPIHGDVLIYPDEHLAGKGCPHCAKGEKYIAKIREKFGDIFGLDEFVYCDTTTPITLICKKHGAFTRMPNAILSTRCGCPKCGEELSNQLNEQAHKESLERQAEERRLKVEAEQRAREEQIEEYENQCAKLLRISKASDSASISYYSYCDLVKERTWLVRYKTKWIKRFQDKYIVDPQSLIDKELYDEGDLVYCFPNEAPSKEIEEFHKNGWQGMYRLDDYLCKSECAICFQGDDLYIIFKRGWYPIINCENQNTIEGTHDRQFTDIERQNSEKEMLTMNASELPTTFVAVDFETLYSQRVSACSIGLAKYIDGKKTDTYYRLIRPPFDYVGKKGPAITWIHGFTEEMLKDERPFNELLPEIEAFIGDMPLVAHYACVEKNCFRDVLAYYDLSSSIDYENMWDTLPISKRIEKSLGIYVEGTGTHSLDVVCDRFRLETLQHHNALDDAIMCGDLFVKFREILDSGLQLEEQGIEPTLHSKKGQLSKESKIQRTDLENIVDNPFKGKAVVLTGVSYSVKQKYADTLQELGAKPQTSVSSKTGILIVGPTAGPSKMQKAEEIGAEIMPEEKFLEIIKSYCHE